VPPFTILHVCMGNICRSPMAERLTVLAARELVGDKADGLIHVHSTGVGGWHVGNPMEPPAARQVLARGGDVDGFACRRLRPEHIDASDLILTATADQSQYAVSLRPDAAERVFVLGEFGRLLAGADAGISTGAGDLPVFAPEPHAVHARGVALVAAVASARGGRPPRPADDLDDPYGRGDAFFGRVADEIEETTRPLARWLLT
jgi:protein-tyrosine phosphatase